MGSFYCSINSLGPNKRESGTMKQPSHPVCCLRLCHNIRNHPLICILLTSKIVHPMMHQILFYQWHTNRWANISSQGNKVVLMASCKASCSKATPFDCKSLGFECVVKLFSWLQFNKLLEKRKWEVESCAIEGSQETHEDSKTESAGQRCAAAINPRVRRSGWAACRQVWCGRWLSVNHNL